jgi:uncharacterized protein (DUF362 family)
MPSKSDGSIGRRKFLKAGAAASIAAAAAYSYLHVDEAEARVGIYRARSYSEPLADMLRRGLLQFPHIVERARAGRVVLKPNLVEYHDGLSVNTHPAMVAAAIAAFRSVGARSVVVAEGPGHCRDTELLLERSDLEHALTSERCGFVDLNLDSARAVRLPANYTWLDQIEFGGTLLGASLIVSMPKLKTHHWAGVTLSLKNMFGTVPGARYGWPKNILHWRGIENSIVDINTSLKPHFAIIDGIHGMEGDGPLLGQTVESGVILMGDNLTAVDATATRVMGMYPQKIKYMQMMRRHGGTLTEAKIRQVGESIAQVQSNFKVLDDFADLKKAPIFT